MISRGWDSLQEAAMALWVVGKASVVTVASHWSVAALSVVLAFGVWFVVTDVENPRVEGAFPASGEPGIRVDYVNVPEGFVVADQHQVSMVIEAREAMFDDLRPDDFTATVDMLGAPDGPSVRPVQVESDAENVRVLSVVPSEVTVTLREAASREVPVTVRPTGSLPDGFEIAEEPTIEPDTVTVTGLPQIVDEVARVELPVDFTGRRADFTETARLEAVTESGNVLTPGLSETTGTASYHIVQQRLDRRITLLPRVEGDPAEGFAVTGVEVAPQTIVATGEQSLIESLERSLTLDPVDVTGATEQVVQQKMISLPEGLSTETRSATVTVEIGRIGCGDTDAVCSARTFLVAPRITDIPEGLRVTDESVQVGVPVVGPLEQIGALAAGDIQAVVSLADASTGTREYEVDVRFPEGFEQLGVSGTPTVSLTLASAEPVPSP